jgi:Predicted membrane-bound metal-dependent hydrolases
MNGKTHAGIAALTYIAACDRLSSRFNYISIAMVIFASLLPDIDHPKSIFNRYIFFIRSKGAMVTLYICLGIIVLYGNYQYYNKPVFQAIGVCLIVIGISSHRNGLTHSLTGLIVFACIVGYITRIYNFTNLVYWFVLGYFTHLVCDMATNRGVPLFYPFRNKKVKLPVTYRVGSKTGNFIEQLIMIAGLIYFVYKLPGIF